MLLPPEVDGQKTCLLLHLQILPLSTAMSKADFKQAESCSRTDLLLDATAALSCEGSNCICHHIYLQQGAQISPNLRPYLLKGLWGCWQQLTLLQMMEITVSQTLEIKPIHPDVF